MDSKIPFDEPPPYSATSTTPPYSEESLLNALASHLLHHITLLPDRIRDTQQVWRAEQSLSDALLLDHIVPIVEQFLAELGAQRSPVQLATLTIVPANAIPRGSTISSFEYMKRRGEECRVARLSMDKIMEKSNSATISTNYQHVSDDPSWVTGQEFNDWGRFDQPNFLTGDKPSTLWWKDEEMAQRLASYLQPKRERVASMERDSIFQTATGQMVPAKKETRSWGWGRTKYASNQKSQETATTSTPSNTLVDVEKGGMDGHGAEMVFTAQEVAFRHENEFGILESFRGWGIVLTVKVKT
ncbi:uncharacterized protein GGS25DRAFT_155544 [Hypoxylon fragiforme]|uniref:uncharacterized protein n=1 Tax=Hypoxylon fragiforme TaxID=63214 RepID=UPI0020C70C1D|nr:uncharacterized protein GGS25DRAFT_155544 [Hypoxylon fragiforme]KAI2610626.1 hypothetical protein GGS25DRAFT_155544 [Hypoxylon fragiforme]